MKFFKLLITCTLLFSPALVYASTKIVYGPHTFTREIAKPSTLTDSFEACDPTGSFKIIVLNGDEAGKNRISSGVISINGIEIIKQNAFNQKTGRIEKVLSNIAEVNTISVELGSKPWSHITVSVEGIMSCLEVNITEPIEAATINNGLTIVKGTLESQTADVGVSVNGIIAEVNGAAWATVVPLKEGENIIKVMAIDGEGNSDEKSVTVNCANTALPIAIAANPSSGLSPMEALFNIESNLANAVASYKIDFDGNGVIDLETPSAEGISHTYGTQGLYLPVLTVEDNLGNLFTVTTVVNVQSFEQVDALIQGKWADMSNALKGGNIERALAHFLDGNESKYKKLFEALKDKLAEIHSAEETLRFVKIYERWMEYENIVLEGDRAYSYPVIWIKDENGLWKIKQL